VNVQSRLVAVAAAGARLDVYVSQEISALSRARAKELIVNGDVLVDGRTARPAQRVDTGQRITVELPAPAPIGLTPEPMGLEPIYEDEDLLVLDKPAGLVVHPGPGHREHTMVHGLLALLPDLKGIGGSLRPGIVHRLDLDTSGLLAVAKTDQGQASLSAQFAARTVKKGYLALLDGRPAHERGTIDAPIGRDPRLRQRMAIVARGRPARTRYVTLARLDQTTLVLAVPLTGRTHQIRVHFASIGSPLAGDVIYGGSTAAPRQFLHAAMLRFSRPSDGASVELSSQLPPDLVEVLRRLLPTNGGGADSALRRIQEMVELGQKYFQAEMF
jgi:23S rRNA pseudouridine1911/1915/1917 synthase